MNNSTIESEVSKLMYYIQEQIDQANQADLVLFLQSQGKQLTRAGQEYRWTRHDSLTVRGNKWYRHSQSQNIRENGAERQAQHERGFRRKARGRFNGTTSSRRSSHPNPQAESAKRRPFALCTFALSR
nr:hypothetical protein [Bifidobacterium catenulatum]